MHRRIPRSAVGQDALVITGRSVDLMTGTGSNIWALPAGLQRDGAEVSSFLDFRNGSVVSACTVRVYGMRSEEMRCGPVPNAPLIGSFALVTTSMAWHQPANSW